MKMLSDVLSDFAESVKTAITDLSNDLEYYQENDELHDQGNKLAEIIDLCSSIQNNAGNEDTLDLKLFTKLYKSAHSIRIKQDSIHWNSPIVNIGVDKPTI